MPAPLLVRLTVLQRLTALLETTAPLVYRDNDGAEKTAVYDFTGKVIRGRKTVSAKDAIGRLAILEAPRPDIGSPAGVDGIGRLNTWTLNVQGWPEEDRDNPSDPAYLMSEAITRHLRERVLKVDGLGNGLYPEHLLGGLVSKFEIAHPLVLPPNTDLSAVTFFYIPIAITLAG